MLLWIGWSGFNAGSAGAADRIAGLVFVNTAVATGIATLSWLAGEVLIKRKASVLGAASDAIGGLFAIAPDAGFARMMGSVILGLVSGPVCLRGVTGLKELLEVDDTFDAFGVHGVGAAPVLS